MHLVSHGRLTPFNDSTHFYSSSRPLTMKITRAVSWQHARLFIAAWKISAVKMWSIVYIVFIVYCSSSSYHTITRAPNCQPPTLLLSYHPIIILHHTLPTQSSSSHPNINCPPVTILSSYSLSPIIILPFHHFPTLYSSSHPQFILSPPLIRLASQTIITILPHPSPSHPMIITQSPTP